MRPHSKTALRSWDGARTSRDLVLAHQRAGLEIGRLQVVGHAIELARIGACDELSVDSDGFAHAAHVAPESEPAIRRRLAVPAAFGLVRQQVEPPRNVVRRFRGPRRIGQHVGIERAGDCRLLEHEAGIMRREAVSADTAARALAISCVEIVAREAFARYAA